MSWHRVKHLNFSLLFPACEIVSVEWLKPEAEPVRMGITSIDLIVKLELLHTIVANCKSAGIETVLVDTGVGILSLIQN